MSGRRAGAIVEAVKVERVYLKNFKAFEELDLVLNENDADPPSLVALIGDNGSGKTSVLDAIATLAHPWHEPFPNVVLGPGRRDGESIGSVDLRFADGELEDLLWPPGAPHPPGPHVLRVVSARGVDQERANALKLEGMRGLFAERLGSTGSPLGEPHGATAVRAYQVTHQRVAYTTARRSTPQQEVKTVQRLEAPSRRLVTDHGVPDFKQHLVDLNYLRLARLEQGKGSNPLQPYFALVERLFPGKRLEGVTEDLRVVFRTVDGLRIDFDDLSAGERSVLALFSSLIRAGLRRSVILIDEPEQHLHPRWQAELPRVLAEQARQFENQFILATHSVEVVEGIQREGGLVFSLSPPPDAVAVSAGGSTQSAVGPG